jgi:Asp/Glu/hydantoin racemase
MLAEASGADAIFNCCSSVGEAADMLARAVDIPVVKIDDAMARRAVELGSRIGVIGTVATTLDPTRRLIEHRARQTGKPATVSCYLVDGAFDALMAGNPAEHDRMVMAEITRAASENDVVALAQGSMARLVPLLDRPGAPVLSSPRLGVEALREVLASRARAARQPASTP